MNTAVLRPGEGPAYWAVGILHTFLTSGEQTGGAYSLMHVVVPPQVGPPPHRHGREDEAFYLLEGEMLFHADGKEFRGTAGAWVTLPKGTRHFFKNVGQSPAKMLVVMSPAGLEKFFMEVGTPARGDAVTQADIDRLLAAAPKYGLEIGPPG
jgi:quercetin dioxygenase-like cupin family protein